ncbi:hypothetical protein BV25DRAFT_1903092 [Artomyces pyxidatus]|uniref:Uncharacterized protein n=1 Tax=Artomyces pyxidatus TaxID=48021 RepID=A0ACB8SKN3_9AGAM|nr:hypothetical protein BV25DRAFT_1903092 [Artomyces pyxidatus]
MHTGRVIPIVQSRGTGKSRLVHELGKTVVHELGKTVPTLSVTLRGSEWPPRDEAACEYFASQEAALDEEISAAFLGATARELADSFTGVPLSHVGLPTSLNVGSTGRREHFEAIKNRATAMLRDNREILDVCQRTLPEERDARETLGARNKMAAWRSHLVDLFCREVFTILAQRLATRGEGQFFLAFDGLPPWTNFDFNQFSKALPPIKTAAEALKLERLRCYGRLYWQMFAPSELLKAAKDMLFTSEPFGVSSVTHSFDIFANRVILDSRENLKVPKDNVLSVTDSIFPLVSVDNKVIIPEAPSKPLAAIAAAEMALTQPRYTQSMSAVSVLIALGTAIDPSPHGGLCHRLLLVMARDFAVRCQEPTYTGITSSVFGEYPESVVPVTLTTFLQTLLGQNLGVDEDHPELTKLLEFGNDCWINFTYLARLERDVDTLTPELLLWAWEKGIAFQSTNGQAIIDIIVPHYKGDLSAPIDHYAFGTTAFQNKIDTLDGTETLTAVCFLKKGPDSGDRVRYKTEHVVIGMDLGAERKPALGGQDVHSIYAQAKMSENGLWHTWSGWLGKAEPKRWCLNVRGFSAKLYPVTVTDGVEFRHFDDFRETLLQSEHPRDKELRPFAAEMKLALDDRPSQSRTLGFNVDTTSASFNPTHRDNVEQHKTKRPLKRQRG